MLLLGDVKSEDELGSNEELLGDSVGGMGSGDSVV